MMLQPPKQSHDLVLRSRLTGDISNHMNDMVTSYRFAQAAAGIGIAEGALRNWMTRNKLDLFGERPVRGWRAFSENDVFILAIAAEMVRFGAVVNDAVDAAREGLSDVNFRTWEGRPDYLFAAPSRFGGWMANRDEHLTCGLSGSPSVLKIAVPIIFAATRRRLAAATLPSGNVPPESPDRGAGAGS